MSVCGDSMPPGHLSGRGTISEDNTMSIDYTVHCDSGQSSITHITIGYTYDEATDTLHDAFSVWSR